MGEFRIGRKHAQHSYPNARDRAGAQLGQLAHGFGDSGNQPTAVTSTPTLIAQVTVTPKVSGKFQMSASAVFANSDTSNPHLVGLQFGVNGPPALEYPPTVNQVKMEASAVGNDSVVAVPLVAERGSGPAYSQVAPLNIPITFALFATSDVPFPGASVNVPARGAQLIVEELPN